MSHSAFTRPNALALAAISLWALLAWLGVSLAHVPPFLLTGIALMMGSLIALPLAWRSGGWHSGAWATSPSSLVLGVYGLFGFHLLLFVALRHAPPVQANLVNYLWPLGMVILAPVFLPHTPLKVLHVVASVLGFAGAGVAILGGRGGTADLAGQGYAWGYAAAAGSAFVWASYSLLTKRRALEGQGSGSASIGLAAALSGLLSLCCHAALEDGVTLGARDWALMAAMGLGPLGAAFYLWDAALKRGNAQHIGVLSYITPLASTCVLLLASGQDWNASLALAALLIVGAAALGTRA